MEKEQPGNSIEEMQAKRRSLEAKIRARDDYPEFIKKERIRLQELKRKAMNGDFDTGSVKDAIVLLKEVGLIARSFDPRKHHLRWRGLPGLFLINEEMDEFDEEEEHKHD